MKNWTFLLLLLASPATAGDVAAVLSSESGHYREALKAFQEVFGATVPVFLAGDAAPRFSTGTRVVVAFGTKASLAAYPAGMARVSCLAPGLIEKPAPPFAQVQMTPPAPVLLERFKEVHPPLKRLLVFWVSEAFTPYVQELERAGKAAGIAITAQKLAAGDALSGQLGALEIRPQSIWIPPDPALVTSVNVSALLVFSSSNRVLFFSPNAQFAEMGAAAAVSPDFKDIARATSAAVKDFEAGRAPAAVLYPDHASIFLNRASAQNTGVVLTPELQKKAKTIY